MFNKKKCNKCGNKVGKSYDFCPYCGNSFNQKQEDWGMLGKNDTIPQEETNPFSNSFLSGLGGGMFGKMINSTIKMLEKEMQKEVQNKESPRTNLELFINGKRINPQNISVKRISPKKQTEIPKTQIEYPVFSKQQKEKFSKLLREEPLTSIRRLSDKIIYEIELPKVNSIKDISINKLEQSTEIRALAKNKAYFKILQISLPIINYFLEKEKLILELGTK